MTRLDGASLDRWITGNYGEDQFAEPDAGTDECQMNDCHQVTEDGVLCAAHQEPERKDQPMTQTTSYVNRSAACGAWRNLAGDDNDHESCTGQVSLPPPDDVCRCHCHGVRVGSFFICSWGYDQTNVDFYRVESLSASGKTAKVALWSSNHTVDGRHVVPGDGPRENFEHGTNRWLEVGDTITKRLRPPHTVGHDRWSFFVTDYADAYLWDGRPAHETPIGEGH